MAEKTEPQTCFVIMPITTPRWAVESYNGDVDHFAHVLEHLFRPALDQLGYTVIPPAASGGDVIQASIIRNLNEADLVLCDLSTLNANVLFELGIRTALDKPVCMVADTVAGTLPFDTGIVNTHRYDPSLEAWVVAKELPKLADHIAATTGDGDVRNSLWRYFGVEAGIERSAALNPEDATSDAKLDLILRRLESLEGGGAGPTVPPVYRQSTDDLVSYVRNVLAQWPKALIEKIDWGVSPDQPVIVFFVEGALSGLEEADVRGLRTSLAKRGWALEVRQVPQQGQPTGV